MQLHGVVGQEILCHWPIRSLNASTWWPAGCHQTGCARLESWRDDQTATSTSSVTYADGQFANPHNSYCAKPGRVHRCWPCHEDTRDPGRRSMPRRPRPSAVLRQIPCSLPPSTLQTLVVALVLFRLNSVLAGLPAHCTMRRSKLKPARYMDHGDTTLSPMLWWRCIGRGSRIVLSSNRRSLSTGFRMAKHRAISDLSFGCLTFRVNRPRYRRHRTVSLSLQYAVRLWVQGRFRCLDRLSGTVYRRTSLLSTVYLSFVAA
jgi:hypothetical protein